MLSPGDFSKLALPAYLRKGSLESLSKMLESKLLSTGRRGQSVQDLRRAIFGRSGSLPEVASSLRRGPGGEAGELRKTINKIMKVPEAHGSIEIPLADRLKSYKHWKKSGKLPGVTEWYPAKKGPGGFPEGLPVVDTSRRIGGTGIPYEASDELVRVFHGTSEKGIAPTLSGRATNYIAEPTFGKKRAVIPGQLGMHTKGSFWSTNPEEAAFYAAGADKPRLIEALVPKRRILTSQHARTGQGMPSGEVIVPGEFSKYLQGVKVTDLPRQASSAIVRPPAKGSPPPKFSQVRSNLYPYEVGDWTG